MCEHRPSPNPRCHHCVKCGKRIPPAHERDLDAERKTAEAAGRLAGVPVDAIADFADGRAGAGHVRDFRSRDFVLEIREELADALNYGRWLVAQIQEYGGKDDPHEELRRAQACLAHVAAAYHELVHDDS